MERKYINSNITVATNDITKLSNSICESLECGDIVRKVDKNCKKETYIIAKKENNKMSLVHVSSSETKEVVYEKGESGWAYKETKEGETISQETLADIKKFLGGEMPNNDVLALIQENGIVFDVRYYFVDDKIKIGSVPDDYTGSAFRFDKNGKIVIQCFDNGLITKYVEIGYNDIFINDVTFSQKATVWEVEDYAFDELEGWIMLNFNKIKRGDIIYSLSAECVGYINLKYDTNVEVRQIDIVANKMFSYSYAYSSQDEEWQLDSQTETPIGFNQNYLTHSFDELDPTLKQIVDDAIADGGTNGVACTQAQWNAIKSLLDKSLFLNYNGNSLIKTVFDGIGKYSFGFIGDIQGCYLEFSYSAGDTLLFVKFTEL